MHISVTKIPGTVDPQSARVVQVDGSKLEITHVKTVKQFGSKYLSEDINKQEEVVRKLQGRFDSVEDAIATLKLQLDFINLLVQKESKKEQAPDIGKSVGIKAWDKVLEFVSSRGSKFRNELREAQNRQQEVSKELGAEKKKLEDLLRGTKKVFYNVDIEVTAEEGGARSLALTYQVRNTGWRPIYHFRANTETKDLTVDYFGEIRQRTGEDWKNIELQLSTGQPALGVQPPKLPPWVVNFQKPGSPRPLSLMREGMKGMEAPVDTLVMSSLNKAPSSILETGNALLYSIPGRRSIFSGVDDHRARITRQKFDLDLKYKTVPKYTPNVFLSAQLTNDSDYDFLPGRGWIYVDDGFIGNSWIPATPSKAKLALGLGADTAFKVERILVKREGGQEGIFGKRNRMRLIYEIKLGNYKKKPVTLEVVDQLPLPYHEDIVVKQNTIDPPPTKKDEKNLLTWEIDLEPSEEKVIRMDFQIEYPEGKIISGL